MRQIARNNRNKCSRVNFATINNRFSGLFCLQGGRISGGAFISQWKRWSGVFAPSRENENKTIHRFLWYPRVCG